ncbi:MAG: OmpA family protein [Solirubrobacterales bacterium]|nr:OmpA family protein [Solirubrobacterales bacterium]
MKTFPSGISSYGVRARVGVAAGLAIGVVAALVGVTSTPAVAHPSGERTLTGAQLVSAGNGRSSGEGALGSLVARDAVSAALGRSEAAYAVRRGAGGRLGAESAREHLHITFSALGARVANGSAWVRFGLAGARSVVPAVSANRVSYRYAGLTEWFVNGPAGLEQGFTITRPHPGGWLSLLVSAAGNRPARQVGSTVEFGGATGIGYGGLMVTDRRGRRLSARMDVSHGRVRISMNTAGASYPVTIDPTINQSAELNALGSASLGTGVAMSGSTVVVGDPGTSTTNGQVYVYTEPAGGWQNTSQPTAVLTPNDAPNPTGPSGPNNFGESVAIDGGTIVVGATGANSGDGAVYIYDQPAGGWQTTSNQTNEINLGAGGAASGGDNFGISVAVSGSTAAVGADGAGTHGNGEVFVVNLANSQTQTLNPSNDVNAATPYGFGGSVSISGSTLVVGAIAQGSDGTAYIYNGVPSSPITIAGTGGSGTFGSSVATNGSTVAVGAPQDGANGGGEVDLYNTTGQPVGVLGDPNGQSADDFGVDVAMSGSTVVVGADQAASNAPSASGNGLAYAFDTSGQQLAQLSYTDPSPNFTVSNDDFGVSVGASPNGIVVGADGHGAGGSAYVYGETLSATTSGSGTVSSSDGQVSCPGDCSATYIPGAQVTLNATPATGSVFTGWSGACSGTGPCQVTMSQAQAVTATFAAQSGGPPNTAPPVNTAPPTITGTGQVGATLACSPGQWTGSPNYAYQWERNGAVIPSATTSTHTTTSADQNTTIQCLVTATNAGGSASAISNGITVANAQPPTGTLTLSRGQVVGHNHLRFSCTATTVNLTRCTITALVHGRVLASGTAPGNGSTATVQLTLTKYGLKLLGQHPYGVRVAIDAAATSTASQALTATRSVLLGMAQQMLIPAQGMFAPNLPQLTPFGSSFLRSVAAELRHRAARVVCLGYTAAPGDRLQNTPFSLALSQERAQLACKFLRRGHVSATYGTEALGKIDPLVPNTTPANLARNRRVEFRVTSGLQIKA